MSFANLVVQKRQTRGQVATFLLLMVVGVLVFALATANLGNISLMSTRVANATDSATLALGSQLATKANFHWQTLGQRIEKCKRTGLLALVLAIIFVVIALVITIVTWGAGSPLLLMAIGAAAGAAGGAAGGAIAGTGALQGAIQGAAIGAAIGAGVGAGQYLGAYLGAEIGAMSASLGPALGAQAGAAIGATVGGIAGGALSAGGSLFTAAVKEQMTSDAFEVAARRLNGLPEHDHIREQIFLQVLPQVVDDPNVTNGTCRFPGPVAVTGDPLDTDGDGDKTEQIPCFQHWQEQRITNLKDLLEQLRPEVEAFLNGPMSTFEAQAEATYLSCSGPSRCGDQVCDFDEQCGWVNQCETDCGSCGGTGSGETSGTGSGETSGTGSGETTSGTTTGSTTGSEGSGSDDQPGSAEGGPGGTEGGPGEGGSGSAGEE